ncbi:MAG: hypothetical protein JWM10_3005 [Myxococcaceae bacterium]|nr:hypothetical protein [Myxococcaceae bacterium]
MPFLDCPPDARLTACTRCTEPVESVDGRGRCDDCGCDRLLAGHDEVSTFDFAAAVGLGRLSFTAHLDRQASIELTSDPGFLAWCDALRDEAIEHETQNMPWEIGWTPADAAAPANDDADDAGAVA